MVPKLEFARNHGEGLLKHILPGRSPRFSRSGPKLQYPHVQRFPDNAEAGPPLENCCAILFFSLAHLSFIKQMNKPVKLWVLQNRTMDTVINVFIEGRRNLLTY